MLDKFWSRFFARIAFCGLVVCGIVAGSTGSSRPSKTALAAESNFQELNVSEFQAKIYSAISKTMPAVVAIGDRGEIFSGVIVTKEGIILSAGHAVRPNRTFNVVLADGRQVKATGLGSDRRVDIAMLKILDKGTYPFAEMGNSAALVRNQPCIGISHPGRFNRQRGAVVRLGHITNPVTTNQGMIQSTAKIEPGDSGGALLDLDGKVIGIHSNIRRSESENYDVPVDTYRKFWDELNEANWLDLDGQPSLPKLGFRGAESEDSKGVEVLEIKPDGFAKECGLKASDVVTRINDRRVKTAANIYSKMIELRQKGIYKFDVTALRDGKTLNLKFDLTPKTERPEAYAEMTNLAAEFKTLEGRLDDHVFPISSKINGKTTRVLATRVSNAGQIYLVSKSSRVGEKPQIDLPDSTRIAAKVITRDATNDLILLSGSLPAVKQSVDQNGIVRSGLISLDQVFGDLEELRGKLLLTPDPNGAGEISIWGSRYFNVPRTQASGGFLGVRLDMNSGKVIFARVMQGAAKKAGLKSKDILLRIGDRNISQMEQVFSFLRKQDPNSTIKVVVLRGDEELTKEIVLGRRPEYSGHVADSLIGGKSSRRDGFDLVIAHDAELNPDECGGPVFDLTGNFLGINMARFSRSSSYVLPKSLLKQFVDQARGLPQ
ncbi:MAG: trypsin-like peptidase domain-containing protein [Mariniblastus sp.]